MSRLSMTDARLELEYFERIDVNPRLTLLRVGGSPAPDEDALALVVTVDGEDFRTAPLGGSVSVEEGGRWRAAFPVPSERLEGSELSYTLETGETVELPEPSVRVLPARAAEGSGAAAVEEPGAGEEERAVEEPGALAEVPALVEDPAVAEEPALVEDPVVAEEPAPVEDPAVAEQPVAAEEPAEPPFTEAPLSPSPRRGGRRWLLALLALLVAVVAAVIIVVVAGNGTDDDGTELSKQAPKGGRSPATLAALPEAPKGATAQVTPISDGRATLTVSGLSSGTYEAWLYNEILDAEPLTVFHGPQAKVTLELPADVGHFRDVDVSREGDGNPGHSGQSVLRVSLASLTG